MGLFLKKTILTLIFTWLCLWVLQYGGWHHILYSKDYNRITSTDAAYMSGIRARYELQPEKAMYYFQQAVNLNVLHVDAWLQLSQIAYEKNEMEMAWNILLFIDELTDNVVRWKWPKLLMARDLGKEDIYIALANSAIPHHQLRNQALELLDTDYRRQTPFKLRNSNLHAYLDWLMGRNRIEDSFNLLEYIEKTAEIEHQQLEKYIAFLIRHKQISDAVDIWRRYDGDGLTNPNFELPITGNAFGWSTSPGVNWQIKRVRGEGIDGGHAVKIVFSGTDNISFHHFRQIVPVQPGEPYELRWWWRSQNLTTDQLPFIEIRGYGCTEFITKSEMIPAHTDWKQELLLFTVPDNCNAVLLRLRRHKSYRFDSKIRGRMWLDSFTL